jgi:uncharacterized pyridoxamine 5'-phosphate oxidase family protein
MVEKNLELKKEVWSYFDEVQTIFLATCSGKRPKVRPVTMINFKDKLWVSTGTKDAKTKQLKKNNNIEFSLLVGKGKYKGSIRAAGKAKIIKEMKTKKLLADNIRFFKQFWNDASDPGFTLIRLDIDSIEYIRPEEMKIHKINV